MSAPHPIAVLDLETTGTDERAGSVMEVGVVLLDPDTLATIDEWESLVEPSMDHAATMEPVVRAMHDTSGLLDALDNPANFPRPQLADVDFALAAWLRRHSTGGRCVLSGSGVSHFDSRWIDVHLPRSRKRLTYWTYDVGVVRRVLTQLADVELPNLSTGKTHRALDDARVHAEELRLHVAMLRGASSELRMIAAYR